MSNRVAGSVRWSKQRPHIPTARISLAGEREPFVMRWAGAASSPPSSGERERADKRALKLAQFAKRLADTERTGAIKLLEKVARATPGQVFDAACAVVERALAGRDPRSSTHSPAAVIVCEVEVRTLDDVEALWFSGALADEYPDNIEARSASTALAARRNYTKYGKQQCGQLPPDHVSLKLCNDVKKSLPKRRANSRRQMLNPLKKLLDICVFLELLPDGSPLPANWLPKDGGSRELQWLYPDEEAKLLACTDVPMWRRYLWGFYTRNGSRKMELARLTLAHFDFAHGGVRLASPMTKTKSGRRWLLDEASQRAARAWCALMRPGAKPTDRMFVDECGTHLRADTLKDLPALLRADLQTAGVTRAELFVTTTDSRNLVVHDLRATYVTVSLALDLSEAEIMRRTGHESSSQLAKYKREAGNFRELQCGDFAPLDEAIPELRAFIATQHESETLAAALSHCPPSAPVRAKSLISLGSPSSIVKYSAIVQVPDMTRNSTKTTLPCLSSPVQSAGAGTSWADSRVEQLENDVRELRTQLVDLPTRMLVELVTQLTPAIADAAATAVLARLQQAGIVERARPKLVTPASDDDEG